MAEVEEQFENFEEQEPEQEQQYEEEPEADALAYGTTAELPEIKLFGRWSCDDVNVSDMSLAVSVYNRFFLTPFIFASNSTQSIDFLSYGVFFVSNL